MLVNVEKQTDRKTMRGADRRTDTNLQVGRQTDNESERQKDTHK